MRRVELVCGAGVSFGRDGKAADMSLLISRWSMVLKDAAHALQQDGAKSSEMLYAVRGLAASRTSVFSDKVKPTRRDMSWIETS